MPDEEANLWRSMEEYDTPNLRRFSFSSIPPGLNSAAAAAGKDN